MSLSKAAYSESAAELLIFTSKRRNLLTRTSGGIMTATPYLLLCGVLLTLSHTVSAGPSFMPSSSTEILRNILLSEPHLILGSSTTLYRLDTSLSKRQDLALTTPNRMLVADPHGTYSGKVLSCESLLCSLVDIADLESTAWQVSSGVVRDGPDNVVGVFAPGPNGVSSLTVGERKIQKDNTLSSLITKGDLINVNQTSPSYNEYASHLETNKFRTREFLAAFNFEKYVYLVTRIQVIVAGGAIETIIHVTRFCELDNGAVDLDIFESHFEIALECSSASNNGNGVSSPSGISAVFVNSTAPFGSESIVLVSASMAASNIVNNYMCSYSLSEINQLMALKLSTCLDGNGKVGFSREGQIDCPISLTNSQKASVDECSLRGVVLPGQEVLLPLANVSFATEQTTGYFTSAVYTLLDGESFLFTGSTEGHLYQFHVQSPTEAVKVREVTLSLPSDVQDDEKNVTQLLASEDGTYIYALTPRKLFRHSVDMCETFSSCGDCLSSLDPICGWCTLESRCTREVNCPSVWVEVEDECPEILQVFPSTLYLQELTPSTTVQVSTRNLPTVDYQCVFDFGGEGVPVIRTAVAEPAGIYICLAPGDNSIPELLKGEDTALSYVSLREQGQESKVVTSVTPVGFTDCSIHASCTSCTESSADCGWCPFSFNCIRPSITCNGDDEESLESDCPSIQPPSETPNYLIHINHGYSDPPLVISGESLDTLFSTNEFVCVICTGNCSTNLYPPLPAVLTQDGSVNCTGRTLFEYTGQEPIVNATLKVQKKSNSEQNIDNPEGTGVILYNCARLGQNCAQCLDIPMDYQCSYCQGDSSTQRECNFHPRCDTDLDLEIISDIDDISQCELPTISTFFPQAGPFEGGTEITITGSNLGAARAHVQNVVVDSQGSSVPCNVTAYEPGVKIQCITGKSVSSRVSAPITVHFTYGDNIFAESDEDFKFEVPTLLPNPANPDQGPESGGTAIEISGSNLGIGSSHRIAIGPNDCSSVLTDPTNLDVITCVSPPKFDDPQRDLFITVNIDNWMQTMEGFTYLQDPTFESISPSQSFLAGGTNYTVRGTNLDSVVEPRLIFYTTSGNSQLRGKRQSVQQNEFQSDPCTIISNTELRCEAPAVQLNNNTSATVTIGLLMDGVTEIRRLNRSVLVYPNPDFNSLKSDLQYSNSEESIELVITGSGFQFTEDQVSIQLLPCTNEDSIAGECECIVTEIDSSSNTLTCEIRSPQNLATDMPVSVTVHLGNLATTIGSIDISEPLNLNLLMILIPVIAGIFIFGFVFFMVVFAVFCRKTRQKDRRYDQLILELEKLESSVARECKLGFAELQTDLDELTGDVAGCRLPYVDMQSYLLTSLFPGAKDHPIMHELQIPSHQRPIVERSLKDFHDLLLDKKVLLIFIHSLEEQRNFSIRDKSIVGSLLMVALHTRLDYATEVLKSLLSELIRRTVTNSYPKLLLRRTESVAEKMLTNWLAICLHGYIMEHAGQPMYLLYRAVKNQLEKGPIDVITGEARYSLSEHKLIRQKVDSGIINATVETEDGLRVPVKVLDCDTASQAKEKLLDAVYKAAPISQRPSLMTVDLEYLKTPLEHVILRDDDHTTVYDGSWKKINTLRHYQVHDGAIFRLVPRKDHAPPGRTWDYPASLISTHCHRQRALSEAEDGTRVWHLFKQLDVEDPKRSPFMNKKMVSEIYLPRMLSTKSILQKFVDDLFNCLFNISHPPSSPSNAYTNFFPHSPGVQVPMGYAPGADTVPMSIKYLFDFLDDEAATAKIQDMDVVHTWKNNALSLRFWVNMIKNPEFVFDINKSHTVDACLSVIAQAFIDGCSFADVKLNIDSPTSKLLYNKEVQGYKVQVRRYYEDVSRLPRVPEDAMQFYLKQLSAYQTQLMYKNGGFITESALFELLRYGIKYQQPFLSNLRVAGLESKAQLFEGVLRAAAM